MKRNLFCSCCSAYNSYVIYLWNIYMKVWHVWSTMKVSAIYNYGFVYNCKSHNYFVSRNARIKFLTQLSQGSIQCDSLKSSAIEEHYYLRQELFKLSEGIGTNRNFIIKESRYRL